MKAVAGGGRVHWVQPIISLIDPPNGLFIINFKEIASLNIVFSFKFGSILLLIISNALILLYVSAKAFLQFPSLSTEKT